MNKSQKKTCNLAQSSDSEIMSKKGVDCVIFFIREGKSCDKYVSKKRSHVKLKGNQDMAEVKRTFDDFQCLFYFCMSFSFFQSLL